MAKQKKPVFVPARTEGWYRAITEEQAAKSLGADTANTPEAYFINGENRAGLGEVFNAPDNYNFMHRAASASEGVRLDLAHELADAMRDQETRERIMGGIAGEVVYAYETLKDSVAFKREMDDVVDLEAEIGREPSVLVSSMKAAQSPSIQDALSRNMVLAEVFMKRHGDEVAQMDGAYDRVARQSIDKSLRQGSAVMAFDAEMTAANGPDAETEAVHRFAENMSRNSSG